MNSQVLLSHGSGGRKMHQLLQDLVFKHFCKKYTIQDDAAVLSRPEAEIAFTTDSFVIFPLVFPGGDIGRLAVFGTVNDLAMKGAKPLAISAGFIVEEGLDISRLEQVVISMADAAKEAGVTIVTGDFKVVERGKGDGIYINTSGIGLIDHQEPISGSALRPGDLVLLSGSMGEHGVAVMAARMDFQTSGEIKSDLAFLWPGVEALLKAGINIRCLRDPTRGGVATALNEWAKSAGVGIRIEEEVIPVKKEVNGACEILGFDPLYVANEGKLLAAVSPEGAGSVLKAMKQHPLGQDAVIIGKAESDNCGRVIMNTALGTTRIIDMPIAEQLPRIC